MNTVRHLDLTIIMPVAPGANPRPAIEALRKSIPKGITAELITVTGTHPTRQRNLAAFRANGRILWFLDHDAIADRHAAARLLAAFRDPRVAVAGGPNVSAKARTSFERVAARVVDSAIGSPLVGDRYRIRGTNRQAGEHSLILCNLAVRREHFLGAGGFDPRLYPNEENDFMNRVKASGSMLMHVPGAAVVKARSATVREFVREAFRYGRGRAEQMWIRPAAGDLPHGAGAVLLAAGLAAWANLPWSDWVAAAVGFVPALNMALNLPPFMVGVMVPFAALLLVRLAVPADLFVVRGFAYGLGMWWGAVLGWRNRSLHLRSLPVMFRSFLFRSGQFRIAESSSFDLGTITMKGAFRHA